MPIEQIVEYCMGTSKDNVVKMKLATNCAPVLKNIKESSLLILTKEYDVLKLMEETNISCRKLYQCGDKVAWLLYRKESLKKILLLKRNVEFLKMQGYFCLNEVSDYMSDKTLEEVLNFQGERLERYINKKADFPHEIGILLGYPIEDVEGFIINKGKNYKYSGYWKVYENPNKILRLFKEYDNAKEQAIRQVLDGEKIKDIAV